MCRFHLTPGQEYKGDTFTGLNFTGPIIYIKCNRPTRLSAKTRSKKTTKFNAPSSQIFCTGHIVRITNRGIRLRNRYVRTYVNVLSVWQRLTMLLEYGIRWTPAASSFVWVCFVAGSLVPFACCCWFSSSADHDSYVVMWHVYVGLCVCVSCMYIAMDFCQARTKRSDDRLTQNHLRPKIDQCYFLERKYGEIIKWKRLSFPISHHFVHVIKSFVFRQPPMSHAFDSCSPSFQSHPHSQTSIILWDDERAFLIRTHRHTYVRVHVNDSHM